MLNAKPGSTSNEVLSTQDALAIQIGHQNLSQRYTDSRNAAQMMPFVGQYTSKSSAQHLLKVERKDVKDTQSKFSKEEHLTFNLGEDE